MVLPVQIVFPDPVFAPSPSSKANRYVKRTRLVIIRIDTATQVALQLTDPQSVLMLQFIS
jgi:hypothetical protein